MYKKYKTKICNTNLQIKWTFKDPINFCVRNIFTKIWTLPANQINWNDTDDRIFHSINIRLFSPLVKVINTKVGRACSPTTENLPEFMSPNSDNSTVKFRPIHFELIFTNLQAAHKRMSRFPWKWNVFKSTYKLFLRIVIWNGYRKL